MWTEITRRKYEREGQRYASDVTDAEWALIEPHMPAVKRLGRPRETELRAVLDAILYIARTGCQWRMLPKDFPPFTTVQGYFYDWRDDGLFEKINFALLLEAREAAGREPSPSAGVIDSQSVKTTESGGPRGYDAMTRIVVAIDPAVTSGEEADETGIIVAGKDKNGHGYVLADISGRYPPIEWARLAITAYATHGADRIVAEVNNGGDMVGATLSMIDPNVAFTAVRASRGKVVRAEPVAALYQQGRVHHIGTFSRLEDQMTNFTTDIDRAAAGYSPDRVDALVWAFSELLVERMESEGIFEFYRQQAEAAEQRRKPQPTQPMPQPGSMEWLEAHKKKG